MLRTLMEKIDNMQEQSLKESWESTKCNWNPRRREESTGTEKEISEEMLTKFDLKPKQNRFLVI